MKTNPIISFLTGLIVSALIIGVVYVCFLLLNFDLAGGETLRQTENQNIQQLFISVALLLIAIFFARQYFKNGKQPIAYGIVAFLLLFVLATTFYLVKQNSYPTQFDKTIWAKSKRKPDDMAKSLVRQRTLIGLTRAQIKALLGEGAEEYGDSNTEGGSILYAVENGWTLSIIFKKDKVIETGLRQPYLGV